MEQIVKLKKEHDATCEFGGKAVRILMSPFDIDRLGWEDGDQIMGLTVVADETKQPSFATVECDAEPNGDIEITEAVPQDRLVPA